jgi:hypothetical protein
MARYAGTSLKSYKFDQDLQLVHISYALYVRAQVCSMTVYNAFGFEALDLYVCSKLTSKPIKHKEL